MLFESENRHACDNPTGNSQQHSSVSEQDLIRALCYGTDILKDVTVTYGLSLTKKLIAKNAV